MTFVGIRLIFVGFTVCRTKRKSARDKMGWATTHFKFGWQYCSGVVTGRDCRARQSACAHDRGPARRNEDLRARAGVPGKVCRDRLPWVFCRDREGSRCVMTEILVWQQGVGQ